MKISLSWLRDYVSFDLTPEDLAHQLTMVGLEVESIDYRGRKFDGFVVGHVLSCEKHPKADRLTICKVDVGQTEPLQIVCGAPNVASGQKVPVGLLGATVPFNQHDSDGKPFVLAQVKLRGVDSYGMICSEVELELGEDNKGIMVLPDDARSGTPLAKYFGIDDIVFEVGITPNRPDCLNHFGIAREVASLCKTKMKKPAVQFNEVQPKADKLASVKIEDKEGCPRYAARVITDVTIKDSPEWLQKRLKAVGLRPINNVVDVTNYVLMETGHPLHAFDYDRLEGHSIVVRSSKDGEKFFTLDNKERSLKSGTVMIHDNQKPVAIGGVMGGLNSEISNTTKHVLLESAYFSQSSIRRTSKYLGLSTDASQRFERGADPDIVRYAIDRAAMLIGETSGGKIHEGIIDVYPEEIIPSQVELRVKRCNELLGTSLTASEMSALLAQIELQTRASNDEKLKIEVPAFRPDIGREADLIEEVARIYGYDNIESRTTATIDFTALHNIKDLAEDISSCLVGGGFNEVINNSMVDPKWAEYEEVEPNRINELKKNIGYDPKVNPVRVKNPLSVEMSIMRMSLVPGILQTIRHNQFHQNDNLKLFEIGHVSRRCDPGEKGSYIDGIHEEERIVVAMVGNVHLEAWDEHARGADLYDIKGEVEALFNKISLDKYSFIPYSTEKTLSEHNIAIEISGTYAGYIGEIRSEIKKQFEIEGRVVVAEINLDILRTQRRSERKYSPVSRFPAVRRDLAFVINAKVPVADIIRKLYSSGGSIVRKIKLFDIFVDDRFGFDKKSVAFRLELQSDERTLTDEEVDSQIKKITDSISQSFSAELRSA